MTATLTFFLLLLHLQRRLRFDPHLRQGLLRENQFDLRPQFRDSLAHVERAEHFLRRQNPLAPPEILGEAEQVHHRVSADLRESRLRNLLEENGVAQSPLAAEEGHNIRRLVKDGFIIRKPTKIQGLVHAE